MNKSDPGALESGARAPTLTISFAISCLTCNGTSTIAMFLGQVVQSLQKCTFSDWSVFNVAALSGLGNKINSRSGLAWRRSVHPFCELFKYLLVLLIDSLLNPPFQR